MSDGRGIELNWRLGGWWVSGWGGCRVRMGGLEISMEPLIARSRRGI